MGLLAGLLLVEAVLQVGSLAAAWTAAKRRGATGGAIDGAGSAAAPGRHVGCAGDSFTFGSGASAPERAYPRQLAERLAGETGDGGAGGEGGREAGGGEGWRVLNAGWPGRSSAELLAALPGLLEREPPYAVCILVGMNDRWNRGAPGAGGEAEQGADFGEAAAAPAPGWRWRWRTKRLVEIAAQSIRDRRARRNAAAVRSPPPPLPAAAIPANPALRAIDADLEDPSRAPDARLALAAYRDTLRTTTDADLAAEIVRVLAKSGSRREAAGEGVAALGRLGTAAPLAREVVAPLARLGDVDEAWRWAQEAVRLAPEDARNWRVLNLAARLRGDATGSLVALARGFALDGDAGYLARQLRRRDFVRSFPEEALASVVRALPIGGEPRARFVALIEECRKEAPFESTLRENLTSIAHLALAANARPLFLTYPHGGTPTSVDLVILDVAEELEIPFVDLGPVFEEAERTIPLEDLYVPDGHCTDRGYGIVADEVARALRSTRPGGL